MQGQNLFSSSSRTSAPDTAFSFQSSDSLHQATDIEAAVHRPVFNALDQAVVNSPGSELHPSSQSESEGQPEAVSSFRNIISRRATKFFMALFATSFQSSHVEGHHASTGGTPLAVVVLGIQEIIQVPTPHGCFQPVIRALSILVFLSLVAVECIIALVIYIALAVGSTFILMNSAVTLCFACLGVARNVVGALGDMIQSLFLTHDETVLRVAKLAVLVAITLSTLSGLFTTPQLPVT
ncbi:hypothetical protein K488DRAFT_87925 [Vararia minispora EC-137]|uniref:Uncharacterized protein n=1 Tax=Vararia minispora EC-137 TaxID=1314806 RepID=A0ACB8QFC1_9AGAM|nr:hypothetical protein K488DRAFT_87925 [Vararia minispora EC-137]